MVLNLIINGIPSIPRMKLTDLPFHLSVLNLIINGIPSIRISWYDFSGLDSQVLNLIINGIPSIHKALRGEYDILEF